MDSLCVSTGGYHKSEFPNSAASKKKKQRRKKKAKTPAEEVVPQPQKSGAKEPSSVPFSAPLNDVDLNDVDLAQCTDVL